MAPMTLGLGLGLSRRSGGSAPAAYSPASLFAASEVGFWAPVTTARLWQDTARTVAVTTPGDLVASWELTTASGPIYMEQPTSTQAPSYQLDGSIPYLDFDGVDNSMSVALNLSTTNEATVIVGVQKDTDASLGIIAEHTANSNTNAGSLYVIAAEDATTLRYTVLGRGSAAIALAQRSAVTGVGAATDKAVISGLYSIATSTNQIRRNKTGYTAATGSQGTGNYANSTFYIGRRGGSSLPFNGRIYGLIVRGAATSGVNLTDAEDWMNSLVGAY